MKQTGYKIKRSSKIIIGVMIIILIIIVVVVEHLCPAKIASDFPGQTFVPQHP